MRPRFNNQPQFQFQTVPTLKITECYYGKYGRIDAILAGHPELVDLIHRDIAEPLALGEGIARVRAVERRQEHGLRLRRIRYEAELMNDRVAHPAYSGAACADGAPTLFHIRIS